MNSCESVYEGQKCVLPEGHPPPGFHHAKNGTTWPVSYEEVQTSSTTAEEMLEIYKTIQNS